MCKISEQIKNVPENSKDVMAVGLGIGELRKVYGT